MNTRVEPLPVSRGLRLKAFTLLELMMAIIIFGMVVTAIYASWSAILRASSVGRDAATDLQRSRIAARTIEDALVSTVMFTANPGLYAFEADTSGDHAALSFVSRLPPSFPGSGYFGDQVVRRVVFTVEPSSAGEPQLVLRQVPLLQTNVFDEADERTIVLARDVTTFLLEFCRQKGNGYEWVDEWRATNQLPKLVRFALAFGKSKDGSSKPRDVTVRTVSIPSVAVGRDVQAGLPPGRGGPGQPGMPGPGGLAPGMDGYPGGPRDPRQGIDQRFGPPVRMGGGQ
jgi:prepilin-type N-terminal cleavage/methylation domain-containing protein